MATHENKPAVSESPVVISITAAQWRAAFETLGYAVNGDGLPLIYDDGIAVVPVPSVEALARFTGHYMKNYAGQSLNGNSLQDAVNSAANGGGSSVKKGVNNAEELAFKAFLTPLAMSKLGIDDKPTDEQKKQLRDYLAQACEFAPLREKYFATAVEQAHASGTENAAAKETKKRTKKAIDTTQFADL